MFPYKMECADLTSIQTATGHNTNAARAIRHNSTSGHGLALNTAPLQIHKVAGSENKAR